MKKIISLFAIATLFIVIFNGCSKSSAATDPKEPITLEANTANDFYIAFETTFFSTKESKNIFKLIANGDQTNEYGYSKLVRYLNTNDYEQMPIGQVWELGNRCYLVVTNSRHLYLSKSNKNLNRCYDILNNIDNFYVKEELPILNAPSEEFPQSCIVGDMTFANGQFCYLGELLFDKIYVGGIVTLSNYQISSDGTKHIIATCGERTVLITEKDHVFSTKQIEFN